MKKLTLLFVVLSCANTYAQQYDSPIKRMTAAQLNELIVKDAIESDQLEDLQFTFEGCDLTMRVLADGGDAKLMINVAWDLAKSTYVFYETQDTPNHYAVKLGVPADDINIKFSLGGKLSIDANLDDTDVDDLQELSVQANDRKEVETLVYRLNKIASGCKGL